MHSIIAARHRGRNIVVSAVALFVLVNIWIVNLMHGGASHQPPMPDWALPYAIEDDAPPTNLIPRNIWQILLPKNLTTGHGAGERQDPPDPEVLQTTPSWLALNMAHRLTLMNDKRGRNFIEKHYGDDPRIISTYNNLPNVGMRSDFLRYLILNVAGGVYTDTDTVALKPVDEWVPAAYRREARLIVGIEYDRRDGVAWADISHWVQFCQWTIAAAPGHPVFLRMIDRALQSARELSIAHNRPLTKLQPTSFEVMNSTGPAAWTDAVFDQLRQYDPELQDTKDLSFLEKPTLIGDVLVLPIDAFGMGQAHSNSTNDGSTPESALVKHLFQGSWRADEQALLAGQN